MFTNFIRKIGQKIISFTAYSGGLSLLFYKTVVSIFQPPFKKNQVIDQMHKIGVDSFSIVSLTALFTGIVLALQSAYQLQSMSAEMYVASLVALSITRELGPVLTALVIAGRMGASIAAELGTMKVTEQIDALQTLAINPIKYLVKPRFLALITMLPILTIYADIVGIFGGYIIGVYKLNIPHNMYMRITFERLASKDVFTGLIKSVIFAVVICIVACFQGARATEGAEGVGRATTNAVVISFVLIIAADCLFTALFYFVFR